MEHHAGLDVSLEETSVCIVDGAGKIIRETQVASEPEALVGYFSALEIKVVCIGLEAGPFIAVVARCIDGSWLRGRPSRDAACEGSFIGNDGQNRPPRCARDCATPSHGLVPAGALQDAPISGGAGDHYGAQDPLGKLIDIELSMRGILRGFGLKVGAVTRKSFEIRVRELMEGQLTLTAIMEGILNSRATLITEVSKLHKAILRIARADGVCVRLMT